MVRVHLAPIELLGFLSVAGLLRIFELGASNSFTLSYIAIFVMFLVRRSSFPVSVTISKMHLREAARRAMSAALPLSALVIVFSFIFAADVSWIGVLGIVLLALTLGSLQFTTDVGRFWSLSNDISSNDESGVTSQ